MRLPLTCLRFGPLACNYRRARLRERTQEEATQQRGTEMERERVGKHFTLHLMPGAEGHWLFQHRGNCALMFVFIAPLLLVSGAGARRVTQMCIYLGMQNVSRCSHTLSAFRCTLCGWALLGLYLWRAVGNRLLFMTPGLSCVGQSNILTLYGSSRHLFLKYTLSQRYG